MAFDRLVEWLPTARGGDVLCPRALTVSVSLTADAAWTGCRARESNGRFHEEEHIRAKTRKQFGRRYDYDHEAKYPGTLVLFFFDFSISSFAAGGVRE